MKLQEQCCTLEQGKRLQELGVKAEATFWHMPEKSHLHKEYIRYGWHSDAIAPAYTVAELGTMLSVDCYSHKDYGICSPEARPMFVARTQNHCWLQHTENAPTEAQARAAMLIYLLENKYYQVSPEYPDPATVESEPRKIQVTVDLNATRVRLHEQYNDITTRLNANMQEDGFVSIHVDELQEPLQNMRSSVAILCHTYFEGNEEFASIGKDLPDMVDFNPNNY